MLDFILAALPWLAIGVGVAVLIARHSKKKKGKRHDVNEAVLQESEAAAPNEIENEDEEEENYMSMGMSLGMCFGVAIGSALTGTFGSSALSYGICFGMLIGMLMGQNIKKE